MGGGATLADGRLPSPGFVIGGGDDEGGIPADP